jgi:hypothetical protein
MVSPPWQTRQPIIPQSIGKQTNYLHGQFCNECSSETRYWVQDSCAQLRVAVAGGCTTRTSLRTHCMPANHLQQPPKRTPAGCCRRLGGNNLSGTLPKEWSSFPHLAELCVPAPVQPATCICAEWDTCRFIRHRYFIRLRASLPAATLHIPLLWQLPPLLLPRHLPACLSVALVAPGWQFQRLLTVRLSA